MSKRQLFFSLVVLSLLAIMFLMPYQKSSKASNGLIERTKSHSDELPNYDIRTDKSAAEKIAAYRTAAAKTEATVADLRQTFVDGEAVLRERVPTLKVEYNSDIRTPEVIAPDVKLGPAFLSGRSSDTRSEILRTFVRENNSLVGVTDEQADTLKVTADYTNPNGNLSFAHLEQFIDGVPVFRGEMKAGFTRNGELIRVINNLAPGLDYTNLSTDFGEPAEAVNAALRFINNDGSKIDLRHNEKASTGLKQVFGSGDSATTAEKMYFPTEPGVAVPAWRVLIWQPVNAFYVIVDAHTGTMLWRKNITEDQTQAATYNVYVNSNALINVAHNPFPFFPGPTSPNGTQGAAIPRTSVSRIGNEAPYTFNNLGWINDGGTRTDGNAIQAGLDIDGSDGVDVNSEAQSATRDFTFAYNPINPNTNTGDLPSGAAYRSGIVTQLFWICNWYHDETYRLGFTEAARNFQNTNFTGQGLGNDRVRGEGQDSSGINNANFSTPADGGRGRMQMYIFTAPNPDVDGSLDADVVTHEFTHGLSNRLHGNGSGLTHDMSRGMGEGWSDYYGLSLLSQASDPAAGVYPSGTYATYLFGGSINNSYYGIRRFPYALKTTLGGLQNRPHNPLTFADIDATTANISDGAFGANPLFAGSTADEVHNSGEIWCAMLWEIRSRMITRLGWDGGNRRAMQLVMDGMKLAPLSPTFINERDAIIAAGVASGDAADVADIWAGFATRGLGASASIQNVGGTSIGGTGTTRVTEAFDLPNLTQTQGLVVSDTVGDNDGFAEPGENISITVPITNSTGTPATSVTATIVGGGTGNYGTLTGTQTASQTITYTVPAGATCGGFHAITINVNSSLGAVSFNRQIFVGKPATTTATENFDGVTAPAFPSGWTAVALQGGVNFVTSTTAPNTAPNAAFALDPTTVGGGTDLTSPFISVTSSTASMSFRNSFNTEAGWDGGVLEISIGGGPFQDILAAGGSFTQSGYNGVLGAGTNNPLAGRSAWNGISGGYLTTNAQLPAAANGKIVQFKWRFGADDNTAGTGWFIDTISLTGAGFVTSFSCQVTQSVKSRADFDGDGRSDLSVYRPSEGNWYLNNSTSGFTVVKWGLSADVPTPGDFDGDGKTDTAIFRPSSGTWYAFLSATGTASIVQFGLSGDVPQAGDYDGDGRADFAVFRPSTNVWYALGSGGNIFVTSFGTAGDLPVRGDYDGDGRTDIAIFRPSNSQWWFLNSTTGLGLIPFGTGGDKPVPADYDGDNKDDVAIYRPASGQWWILQSSNGGVNAVAFGISTDVPVPGDYDGDGRDDQAIYRNGQWWLNRSTSGVTVLNFGLSTDTPIPAKYIP